MKIFHYCRRDGVENFGDRLNLWLWPQLLPGVFHGDGSTLFVGIGTLLNHCLPGRLGHARRVVIFSTGAGYERPLLRPLPSHWRIYCVRGPYSSNQLQLPRQMALTDGAILLRQIFQPSGPKRVSFAWMPHIHHATYAGDTWQQICQAIGFGYIDPRWPVEKVLTAISETEVLLAEAMHGAIAADALRVPWVPVQTSARILTVKWQDWCASIGVEFVPQYLPPWLPGYPPVAQGVRSALKASRYWLNCYRQLGLIPQKVSHEAPERMAQHLLNLADTAQPYLSQERRLAELTEQLQARLYQVKTDIGSGIFSDSPSD